MSWVPLAGSGMGSVLGGFLSDWSTKTRLSLVHGRLSVPQTANRALLAAISCLLSAPVVMLAVRAGFPNCFAILTVSGLLGEMYLGKRTDLQPIAPL